MHSSAPSPGGDSGSAKVLALYRLALSKQTRAYPQLMAVLSTVAPPEGFVGGWLGLYAIFMEISSPNHPLIGMEMNSVNNR